MNEQLSKFKDAMNLLPFFGFVTGILFMLMLVEDLRIFIGVIAGIVAIWYMHREAIILYTKKG